MDIEIISKGCIKPCSPTPDHHRTYKLSLLDQFIPSTYIPFILYYPILSTHQHNTQDFISIRSLLLKQSLSKTLSKFYTFAGKIKDNLSIDCNDGGVYYVEARSSCQLAEFLNQPDLRTTSKFLPSNEIGWTGPTPGSHVAMIQETTFACGSIVIGVLISHVAADGTGATSFLKYWSALAHKKCLFDDETLSPNYDAPLIFPQVSEYPAELTLMGLFSPYLRKAKAAARRIVFDAAAIEELKSKSRSSSVELPTRVEAITALLCKCITSALFRSKHKKTLITHTMNLRSRAKPSFSNSSMGNFLWLAPALCTEEDTNHLPTLVTKIREAIGKIDSDFVNNLQGGQNGGFLRFKEAVKEMQAIFGIPDRSFNSTNYICFTSWCNFGLYDVDFGWGKPAWVTCVGASDKETMFMNSVLLMDTGIDKNIEVWLYFEEEDLVLVENDKELLTHATLDPSPFKRSSV